MIAQNQHDSNSNSYNPDKKGTNSKTSPRTTSRSNLLNLVHRKADYVETDSSNLKKDKKFQIGYVQGVDAALRSLARESNPYERSERYDANKHGFETVRVDWVRCSFDLGKDSYNLKMLKKYLRDNHRLLFMDTHKKTGIGYNHHLEAPIGGAKGKLTGVTLSYSLSTDVEGTKNNKGKGTIQFPGSFFQQIGLYEQIVLLKDLKETFKVRFKRIDERISDPSKFVLPKQLSDWCDNHQQINNRPPIKGIRKNANGDWNYAYHQSGGTRNATFVIGSSPRRLTIYDENTNHGIDAIAWELRSEDDLANIYATDLINAFNLIQEWADTQAREQLRNLADYIHAETTDRMHEYNIDSSQYNEIKADVYSETKQKVYRTIIEKEMYAEMVKHIMSAFTFYDYIDSKEEHITDRCVEAEWFTQFKEILNVEGYVRHTKPKEYTTLDKARRWRDGNWNNSTILLGAAIAGINTKDLMDIYSEDKNAAAEIVISNMLLEYKPVLIDELEKFKRSRHSKLLDAHIAKAA